VNEPSSKPGLWIWLFPVTYVLHITEEYFAGGGIAKWMAGAGGKSMSDTKFLMLTAAGFALIGAGMLLVRGRRSYWWILITLSTVFLTNVLSHTLYTLLMHSYSPGLVTAWLLWAPLGTFTFLQMTPVFKPKTFWLSIVIGTGIHGIVSILAIRG
jgi:uncharacterized protein with HXXEE motif